jgi:hypothetical protein
MKNHPQMTGMLQGQAICACGLRHETEICTWDQIGNCGEDGEFGDVFNAFSWGLSCTDIGAVAIRLQG